MGTVLDHIGIVGSDLGELEAAYRRLGFTVAPRCEMLGMDGQGRTYPLGQGNSHLVFGDEYVELTAVHGDLSTHHLRDAVSRYWGLHILVLRTADAAAEHARLAAAGSAAPPPALAARNVAYPGATGTARFRWFRIPDAEFAEAFLCHVEHLDAELVFDPRLNDHANSARGLTGVTLVADDPEDAAARLAAGAGARVRPIADGSLVELEKGRFRLLTTDGFAARFGGARPPAVPSAAAFSVRSLDLGRSAEVLKAAGVGFTREAGRLWVGPDEAGGVTVEFVADGYEGGGDA